MRFLFSFSFSFVFLFIDIVCVLAFMHFVLHFVLALFGIFGRHVPIFGVTVLFLGMCVHETGCETCTLVVLAGTHKNTTPAFCVLIELFYLHLSYLFSLHLTTLSLPLPLTACHPPTNSSPQEQDHLQSGFLKWG